MPQQEHMYHEHNPAGEAGLLRANWIIITLRKDIRLFYIQIVLFYEVRVAVPCLPYAEASTFERKVTLGMSRGVPVLV